MTKVAIIGTGQIGFDLLHKLLKMDFVEIVAFVGRRASTKQLPDGIKYSDKSINFFITNPRVCNVVFDCTDAYSAIINSKVFLEQGITVIDLTPSNIGDFYIPNLNSCIGVNINMVTCGGQVSIPFLDYIKQQITNIEYIEVVTQINSESAGIATRNNIDKYIDTTETAIKQFINIPNCKVILNINPSISTTMQTTIFIKTNEKHQNINFDDFNYFTDKIKSYIPNYKIDNPIWLSEKILMTHVTIKSSGDILSKYAGNLDIINCAAIHALKRIYDPNLHNT
jgi:acetaldehyde dehydrogenase (acetylating)